eukprot:763585-Hanusia_phi.AAC.1
MEKGDHNGSDQQPRIGLHEHPAREESQRVSVTNFFIVYACALLPSPSPGSRSPCASAHCAPSANVFSAHDFLPRRVNLEHPHEPGDTKRLQANLHRGIRDGLEEEQETARGSWVTVSLIFRRSLDKVPSSSMWRSGAYCFLLLSIPWRPNTVKHGHPKQESNER